jgi:putative FmdB family regulatory protein
MIYQYKCKCGSEIEIERSIHEEALAPLCIDCHETMSRVWTSPAITFNGKGFYTTDK